MKPIEAGCLAIVINATVAVENNGKVVKVLYLAEQDTLCTVTVDGLTVKGFLDCDVWVIEGDTLLGGIRTTPLGQEGFFGKGTFETVRGRGNSAFRSKNLMRIDGGDEELFKRENGISGNRTLNEIIPNYLSRIIELGYNA